MLGMDGVVYVWCMCACVIRVFGCTVCLSACRVSVCMSCVYMYGWVSGWERREEKRAGDAMAML
jgi:hypothetical protein